MEAFSLLKYWRGGAFTTPTRASSDSDTNIRSIPSTIVTAVPQDDHSVETDNDDDDGPFFDLEFTEPDEENEQVIYDHNDDDNVTDGAKNVEGDVEEKDVVECGEGESVFNFTLSSTSNADLTDPNLSLSPSDDIFFNGRLVPIEPSSAPFNSSEPNSKHQFTVSLLKSATKLRVFALGLKKSTSSSFDKPEQSEVAEVTQPAGEDEKTEEIKPQHKLFTVKFKIEDVAVLSLFTRDASAKNSSSKKPSHKQSSEELASGEKRFSKDVMNKYFKKVKPLYLDVSRKYGDKLKFLVPLGVQKADPPTSTMEKKQHEAEVSMAAVAENNLKGQKQGNLPASLRVVCKHLGKSRSASSAVAAAPPGPVSSRRDDSLLQQEDGIQSAILHCKKSFNASRHTESSVVARSGGENHGWSLVSNAEA